MWSFVFEVFPSDFTSFSKQTATLAADVRMFSRIPLGKHGVSHFAA